MVNQTVKMSEILHFINLTIVDLNQIQNQENLQNLQGVLQRDPQGNLTENLLITAIETLVGKFLEDLLEMKMKQNK